MRRFSRSRALQWALATIMLACGVATAARGGPPFDPERRLPGPPAAVSIHLQETRRLLNTFVTADLALYPVGRGRFSVSSVPCPPAWGRGAPPDTSDCAWPDSAWVTLVRAADEAGFFDGRAGAATRRMAQSRRDSLGVADTDDWYMDGGGPNHRATICVTTPDSLYRVDLIIDTARCPPELLDFYGKLAELAEWCDPGRAR